ncbi:tRNA pseudouridine(38-40) synthase TruA [Mycoplasmoides genitalium]|uniref:tRNA pseudouridine(38-40) synthase TruA n=1 Tax=Mycoplasmoides genitalium TaxID=2097 RepID=UPI00027B378D|nr:tRNA pseudouridine(38-40) synthase TruA [Mycoplasmoides genitalium]AFQ04498.1 tRNA pseudouridine synthase A [Mycoplasmoides genitalium M2288]
MARYLGIVSYDGSYFKGWAIQPNLATIQDLLEQSFSLIIGRKIKVIGSGRTDKGVHAINQTFHVDINGEINLNLLIRKINQLIKPHCIVKTLVLVNDSFHARFQVKTKVYEYLINCGNLNPLQFNYVWQLNQQLDLEKLKADATLFLGKKNFLSFSSSIHTDSIRTISKITIQKETNQLVRLTFFGSGFLRSQVRMIVACLVNLNTNKMALETVAKLFEHPKKGSCVVKAPSCGLYLKTVVYEK